jgi:hypothetical protein
MVFAKGGGQNGKRKRRSGGGPRKLRSKKRQNVDSKERPPNPFQGHGVGRGYFRFRRFDMKHGNLYDFIPEGKEAYIARMRGFRPAEEENAAADAHLERLADLQQAGDDIIDDALVHTPTADGESADGEREDDDVEMAEQDDTATSKASTSSSSHSSGAASSSSSSSSSAAANPAAATGTQQRQTTTPCTDAPPTVAVSRLTSQMKSRMTVRRRFTVLYFWNDVLCRPSGDQTKTVAKTIARFMGWPRGERCIEPWVDELVKLTGGSNDTKIDDVKWAQGCRNASGARVIAPNSPSRTQIEELSDQGLGWRPMLAIVNILRQQRGRPLIKSHMSISNFAYSIGIRTTKVTTRGDQKNDKEDEKCRVWVAICKQWEARFEAGRVLSNGDPLAMPATWPSAAVLAERQKGEDARRKAWHAEVKEAKENGTAPPAPFVAKPELFPLHTRMMLSGDEWHHKQRLGCVTRYVKSMLVNGKLPDDIVQKITVKHPGEVRFSFIMALDPNSDFEEGHGTEATREKAKCAGIAARLEAREAGKTDAEVEAAAKRAEEAVWWNPQRVKGIALEPYEYTGKTVFGASEFDTLVDIDIARTEAAKGGAMKGGYKKQFSTESAPLTDADLKQRRHGSGEAWYAKCVERLGKGINKSKATGFQGQKASVNILDMIDHYIRVGNDHFRGTVFQDVWVLNHDPLAQMEEKDAQIYMESQGLHRLHRQMVCLPDPNNPERSRGKSFLGKFWAGCKPGKRFEIQPWDEHCNADLEKGATTVTILTSHLPTHLGEGGKSGELNPRR